MTNRIDTFGDKYLTLKRTPKRDAFWFRLSHSADHSIIWFVLGVVRFIFVQNIIELLYFIIVMAIESALTNGPIKYCFKRTRPYENENTFDNNEKLPYSMRKPITSSFPSGHATAAMCAASMLSMTYHWVALIVFPLGLMIGYSRIYTRMHHLSDVLGGLILGLIYGYLACRFAYLVL